MKKISLIVLLFALPIIANSQGIYTYAIIDKGDTIPLLTLKEVTINGYISYLTPEELAQYAKLIRNVKKTYPYAKQAGQLLASYNAVMQNMNESQRKSLMKQAEKEINNRFGPALKKLTMTQGVILIRLIDRETGNDSYTLVKELRGSFRAFFYQAIGKLFGYNLRTRYNPESNDEDRMIERIIFGIETNKI